MAFWWKNKLFLKINQGTRKTSYITLFCEGITCAQSIMNTSCLMVPLVKLSIGWNHFQWLPISSCKQSYLLIRHLENAWQENSFIGVSRSNLISFLRDHIIHLGEYSLGRSTCSLNTEIRESWNLKRRLGLAWHLTVLPDRTL